MSIHMLRTMFAFVFFLLACSQGRTDAVEDNFAAEMAADSPSVRAALDGNATTFRQQITDSTVTKVIPAEGGRIELPGVVRVTFPAGAFSSNQVVEVSITNEPGTQSGRWNYHLVGGGPKPLQPGETAPSQNVEPPPVPYDVHISGEAEPEQTFHVVLSVPGSYLATVPPTFRPQLLAELDSGDETERHFYYDIIPSEFDSVTAQLRAEVYEPSRNWARQDGTFEVILLIGSRSK